MRSQAGDATAAAKTDSALCINMTCPCARADPAELAHHLSIARIPPDAVASSPVASGPVVVQPADHCDRAGGRKGGGCCCRFGGAGQAPLAERAS